MINKQFIPVKIDESLLHCSLSPYFRALDSFMLSYFCIDFLKTGNYCFQYKECLNEFLKSNDHLDLDINRGLASLCQDGYIRLSCNSSEQFGFELSLNGFLLFAKTHFKEFDELWYMIARFIIHTEKIDVQIPSNVKSLEIDDKAIDQVIACLASMEYHNEDFSSTFPDFLNSEDLITRINS